MTLPGGEEPDPASAGPEEPGGAADDVASAAEPATDEGDRVSRDEGENLKGKRRRGDEQPASEKVQQKLDKERRSRSQGLGYLWGNGWYAGVAVGRDRYDFSGMGDTHVSQAQHDVNINNYYSGAGDSRAVPRFGPIPWQDLEPHKERHAATSSDRELLARVRAGGVTILSGSADTGRRDSAIWALAMTVKAHAGDDSIEVAEITDIEGLFPRNTADDADAAHARRWKLDADRGYMLDVTDLRECINRTTVDALRRSVGQGAKLIILANHSVLSNDIEDDPDLVRHVMPDLTEVFERHLMSRQKAVPPEVKKAAEDLLDTSELAEEVGRLSSPRDAVRIAVDLAVQLRQERSVAEILNGLPRRRRDTLRTDINGKTDDDRERALLVAAAAFQGLPAGTIVRTYEQLIKLLPDKRHKPQPFLKGLAQCWSEYVSGFRGLEEPAALRGFDPPIVLRPPSLGREVLTIAWRDYPVMRTVLIRWLSSLINDDDPSVRIQAAQTIGLFAVLDFDHVAGTTLKRWRAASSLRKRQAVAWAMEAAAGADERIAGQVRKWLRDDDVQTIHQHFSLVEIYRTKIGALFPDDALRAIDALLRKIASEGDDAAYRTWRADGSEERWVALDARVDLIAPIITEIFASGAMRQVLLTLNRWTTRTRVLNRGVEPLMAQLRLLVAAGAMARIARLPAAGPRGNQPPALLRAVADEEVSVERVLPIWRNALADRYMGSRSWEVLRLWVQAPDNDPSLTDPVRRLISELARESLLQRRRIGHEIWQWKRGRGDTPFHAFPNI